MPASTTLYDTIIAGAGPVGLFLACELSLAGCSVLVLEQGEDPSSPLKRAPFGLRGLSVPTIESFDRRGLLDEVEARVATRTTPGTAHFLTQGRRPGGHFTGIQFFHDRIDTARWPYRLSGAVGSVAAEMASIEAILTARAEASGVRIVRGAGIEGFTQTDEVVAVEAGGQSFRGRWLVGCDGARSTVRKAARIGFTGTQPEFTGYSILADRGDAPADLLDSYERERHPIGARVLDWSRAQVALMRPSPSSRALESTVRDLIETPDGATYFAERVSGVSLRHDLGDGHPLVGRSVPDFALRDGSRVAALMRDGRGLLLDFDARAPLRPVADRHAARIGYVAASAVDDLGLQAVLVRPDGLVAFASDTPPDKTALGSAMARWLG